MESKTTIEKNDWEVKAFHTGGTAYNSTYLKTNVELCIDSRGNRISISMQEYRPETNRTTAVGILLTRDEWNQIKALAKETGGEI